jgi:hypothetical protein
MKLAELTKQPNQDSSPVLATSSSTQEEPGTRDVDIDFQGIPIIVEYFKGDTKRKESSPGAPADSYYMHYAYGYVPDTISMEEGDALDVMLGWDDEADTAWVAQLSHPHDPAVLMEDKVLLGFPTLKDAEKAVKDQYGSDMVMVLVEISIDDLKEWIALQEGAAKRESLVDQALEMDDGD